MWKCSRIATSLGPGCCRQVRSKSRITPVARREAHQLSIVVAGGTKSKHFENDRSRRGGRARAGRAGGRIRTDGLLITNQLLCQLS